MKSSMTQYSYAHSPIFQRNDFSTCTKPFRGCDAAYYSTGDWIAPDGTRVSSGTVPGLRITSSSVLVRLLRNNGTPQEGMYQCVVENDTSVLHKVNFGLYNSGEGMF